MRKESIVVSKSVSIRTIFDSLIENGWSPYQDGLWIKSYGEDRWGVMHVQGRRVTRLREEMRNPQPRHKS